MAFANTGFATVAASKRGNAPSIYTYSSTDAIATVRASGYFNDLSDTLAVGDIIFVYDSSTPTMHICLVLSNASGVVDVADGTAVSVTDTD
jgi:hypothetical protein